MKRCHFGSEHSFVTLFDGCISCQRGHRRFTQTFQHFSLAQGPTSTASIAGTKGCLGIVAMVGFCPKHEEFQIPHVDWFVTPWEFSIAHKNRPSQKESSLPNIIFQYSSKAMLNFGGVSKWCISQNPWVEVIPAIDHFTKMYDNCSKSADPKSTRKNAGILRGKKNLLGCSHAAKHKPPPSMLNNSKGWINTNYCILKCWKTSYLFKLFFDDIKVYHFTRAVFAVCFSVKR